MAAEDFVVADRRNDDGTDVKSNPVTAGDKVDETVLADNPDTEAAEAAETAGVSNAAYIGYAAALNAFQSRTDIETLADRRAREYGDTFDDGAFMREAAYNADGTAATPPRPGTVHGDAPASS